MDTEKEKMSSTEPRDQEACDFNVDFFEFDELDAYKKEIFTKDNIYTVSNDHIFSLSKDGFPFCMFSERENKWHPIPILDTLDLVSVIPDSTRLAVIGCDKKNENEKGTIKEVKMLIIYDYIEQCIIAQSQLESSNSTKCRLMTTICRNEQTYIAFLLHGERSPMIYKLIDETLTKLDDQNHLEVNITKWSIRIDENKELEIKPAEATATEFDFMDFTITNNDICLYLIAKDDKIIKLMNYRKTKQEYSIAVVTKMAIGVCAMPETSTSGKTVPLVSTSRENVNGVVFKEYLSVVQAGKSSRVKMYDLDFDGRSTVKRVYRKATNSDIQSNASVFMFTTSNEIWSSVGIFKEYGIKKKIKALVSSNMWFEYALKQIESANITKDEKDRYTADVEWQYAKHIFVHGTGETKENKPKEKIALEHFLKTIKYHPASSVIEMYRTTSLQKYLLGYLWGNSNEKIPKDSVLEYNGDIKYYRFLVNLCVSMINSSAQQDDCVESCRNILEHIKNMRKDRPELKELIEMAYLRIGTAQNERGEDEDYDCLENLFDEYRQVDEVAKKMTKMLNEEKSVHEEIMRALREYGREILLTGADAGYREEFLEALGKYVANMLSKPENVKECEDSIRDICLMFLPVYVAPDSENQPNKEQQHKSFITFYDAFYGALSKRGDSEQSEAVPKYFVTLYDSYLQHALPIIGSGDKILIENIKKVLENPAQYTTDMAIHTIMIMKEKIGEKGTDEVIKELNDLLTTIFTAKKMEMEKILLFMSAFSRQSDWEMYAQKVTDMALNEELVGQNPEIRDEALAFFARNIQSRTSQASIQNCSRKALKDILTNVGNNRLSDFPHVISLLMNLHDSVIKSPFLTFSLVKDLSMKWFSEMDKKQREIDEEIERERQAIEQELEDDTEPDKQMWKIAKDLQETVKRAAETKSSELKVQEAFYGLPESMLELLEEGILTPALDPADANGGPKLTREAEKALKVFRNPRIDIL